VQAHARRGAGHAAENKEQPRIGDQAVERRQEPEDEVGVDDETALHHPVDVVGDVHEEVAVRRAPDRLHHVAEVVHLGAQPLIGPDGEERHHDRVDRGEDEDDVKGPRAH
jgi:hypothetical protein